MTAVPGLSKSRITAFEQCAKRLWLSVHRRELAQIDSAAAGRIDAGHDIGAIACALLPEGVMVEAEPDLRSALATTRAQLALSDARPIFEATFEHGGVLVRIDILEPDDAGGWRMAEVKSSTKAKDYHLGDLATQLWVARHSGLRISSAAIRHINNQFVLEREGDYQGLFQDTELLPQAEEVAAMRETTAAKARAALQGGEPEIELGGQCNSPFPCEFQRYCQAALPPGPEWPVTILPHGGGKRWLNQGVVDMLAIEGSLLTNPAHQRVHLATTSGRPFHDAERARAQIAEWSYPRSWLDFETIGFAAPRWIGTRPFAQTPFQFSAHIERRDGQITHVEFLSLDGRDPRRPCAEALVELLPATGAVVAYNAAFERGCILELAAAFPDLADALRDIARRLVDLLPITRATWYHRDQRGSWSIKAVLPTVAPELDYSSLEVGDGVAAQEAYLEAIHPDTEVARRHQLEAALRAYCQRDTEAMIVLARHLTGCAA